MGCGALNNLKFCPTMLWEADDGSVYSLGPLREINLVESSSDFAV